MFQTLADINDSGCIGLSCPDNPTYPISFTQYIELQWGMRDLLGSGPTG
jgi:hypothetical protein